MKYPVILQHNAEDCGAACIASIAKYYGRIFAINRTREATGTGQLGTTLLNLKQGAISLGFDARGVRSPLDLIDRRQIPLPGIIHWKGVHWVVLYGRKGRKYVVADPAVGIQRLSKKDLVEGWTNGVMLLLEPRPDFYQLPDDRGKISGLGRFFQRIGNYRQILGEALLLNVVVGLLSLISPFLLQILTDDVLVRRDTQLLSGLAIAFLAMNLLSNSLKFVQSTLIAHFAQRLELDITLEFVRSILSLPLSYYETRRSGEIISRLQDIQDINQLISQVGLGLPSQFFIAVVSLGFMGYYSPKLLGISLAIALTMILSTLFLLPKLQQNIRHLLVLVAENQGILVETFKGALVLKTMNAAFQFWEEFQSRYGRQANLSFRAIQIAIFNNTFSSLILGMGGIILLWFGSALVIDKELSIGQLLAFNSMNSNFLALIITVLGFVNAFSRASAATSRLYEVIESTPETRDDAKKHFAKITDNADIVCSNLNFHHAGRVELLENFSLKIPGGKVIALIGKSGCGKSTLAKLIAGLYTPQSGNIRIDLYNLSDLSLECIRQQVVLVPQDAPFWSRSIAENFRLGQINIAFEQIVKACQIADADNFISKLPNKYQTILGEFGANLSGGQRQRLAIARGIVNHPPILILDESTAGLDPIGEAQVLDRLLSHRQGKTTILISHRPRVINRADWIVFLEDGRLKLQGSLTDLLDKPGNHLEFLTP